MSFLFLEGWGGVTGWRAGGAAAGPVPGVPRRWAGAEAVAWEEVGGEGQRVLSFEPFLCLSQIK